MTALEIRNLYVSVNDKEIIRDFNLTMRQGEIHALMGPNGTGKSTLAYAIMGHRSEERRVGKEFRSRW